MGAIISFSSHQLVKCRAAHQMTQYNCYGKNKCSLRYWSLYLSRRALVYTVWVFSCVCQSGLLKTFSLSVCFLTSPPTSYFLMLCSLTFFFFLLRSSCLSFQPRYKMQNNSFSSKNKQSTHPVDIVLLKNKKNKKGPGQI